MTQDHYINGIEEYLSMPDGQLVLTGCFGPWNAGCSFPVEDLAPCEGDTLDDGVFHFQKGVRFMIQLPGAGPTLLDCREVVTFYRPAQPAIARDAKPDLMPREEGRPRPSRLNPHEGREMSAMGYGHPFSTR